MIFWTGCSQNNSNHHDVDEQLVVEYENTNVIDDGVSSSPKFRYIALTPASITEISDIEHIEDFVLHTIFVENFGRVPILSVESELVRWVNNAIITDMTIEKHSG